MNLGELQERMGKLDNWAIDGNCIVKEYMFKDFKESLEFVNKVGEAAERKQHHPSIVIDFNSVRVSLTTHSESKITEKDFELAEELDKL